jgi:hypothetical protein
MEASMIDPDTAPLDELDRQLAVLVRRYRTASHLVAERAERPDGIDDDTLGWWVAAHQARWRRRFEATDDLRPAPPAGPVELRKERLRTPPR